MHKAGKIAVIAGILLIVVGMIAGFYLLATEGESAIIWLGTIIPLGFVILLTGMVTTLLKPEDKD